MPMLTSAAIVAFLSVIAVLFISYIVGGWVAIYTSPRFTFDNIPDLHGKIALVTGSNTGIGYITARELARKGAHVIATTRSIQKGQDALKLMEIELKHDTKRGKVEYLQLDLSSFKSVVDFSKKVKKYKKIDMLILNAGIMFPPFQLTENGFESQIGTNHLGHFVLVKNLMSMIVKSKTRVVTVSSFAHYIHYNYFHPVINYDSFTNPAAFNTYQSYGQSKLANVLFSNALAKRLQGTGATSNALHPGSIKTDLFQPFKDKFVGKGSNIFSSILLVLCNLFDEAFLMKSNDGALTQLYVATSPKVEGVTGKYFEPVALMRNPSIYARDEKLQKELWDMSERLTKGYW